jgi:phage shock protein PspC (stress-responsive transcriptional regulator)
MKKTIPISLARTLFHVEDEATYRKLESYLAELKNYFSRYKDSDEMWRDIEARIREQLLDLVSPVDRIVTTEHIETLIKSMGRPGDFESEEENEKAHFASEADIEDEYRYRRAPVHKRLYRDKENSFLGGVASGIAAYFRIDPLVVRLCWVFSVFFAGFGILPYLLLWVFVPKAKTARQKLEMHGDPVSLDEFARKFKRKSG